MTTKRHRFTSLLTALLAACLLIFTGSVTATAAPGDVVNIPDTNLKQCINETLDRSPNTDITEADLESLSTLYCAERGISNATGLEHAKNLTALNLSNNQLSSIDLAGMTQLTELWLLENHLTSIDLTGLTQLVNLDLGSNQLASVDLADQTQLTNLNLSSNQLSSIDVSGLTQLNYLWLGWNKLSSIDLSGLTQLADLGLTANKLSSVDLTGLTQLKALTLDENKLTSIELADQTQLTSLQLGSNQLTTVDLTGLTKLTDLWLNNNQLASVDLSAQPQLRFLELGGNKLTSVNLSAQTKLTYLGLADNQLSSIDLAGQTKLTDLNLGWNKLSSINLAAQTQLTILQLTENRISSIELTGLTQLTDLNLGWNKLTSIDLTGLSKLRHLGLAGNQLTSIDLTGLPQLNWLSLSSNHLVDFSVVPASVEYLDIFEQYVQLADATAGAAVPVPRVIAVDGSQITAAVVPNGCSYQAGASDATNTVTCSQPGNYEFNFNGIVNDVWHDVTFAVKVTGSGQHFIDVPPGAPFYTEINWMATAGISAGYADGTYRPNISVSRAAMAAFLYRAAGKPAFTPPAVSPFSDVPPGAPFYKEITWMADAGISAGYGDGTYRPYISVSRAAMAAFLYRAYH